MIAINRPRESSRRAPSFAICLTLLFTLLLTTLSAATMSDDAYESFLDKANQDTGAGQASAAPSKSATNAVSADIPSSLQGVDQYYTSEADEPFEPVSLQWDGGSLPDESM